MNEMNIVYTHRVIIELANIRPVTQYPVHGRIYELRTSMKMYTRISSIVR